MLSPSPFGPSMWDATHGEVDPAFSLVDLAALIHPIHLYDLSYGVDYH
jgi:hypothetical protein